MSRKSFANGACSGPPRQTSPVIAAPAAHPADVAIATKIPFEIPPEPLNPAPVAAPKTLRTAGESSPVPAAEAAPRKSPALRAARTSTVLRSPVTSTALRSHVTRNAADDRRDSPLKPRATPTRRAKSHKVVQSNGRHAVDCLAGAQSVDGTTVAQSAEQLRNRLANARVNGRIAAAQGSQENAASDDVQGTSAAGTGSMDTGCADLNACADAALSRLDDETLMAKPKSNAPNEKTSVELDALKVPTDPAALMDGPTYVRAVAQHVDLVGASARLVVSQDEKVCKTELDRLRELIFGKGGPAPVEEPLRIDWTDFPRPDRDRRNNDETTGGERGDD